MRGTGRITIGLAAVLSAAIGMLAAGCSQPLPDRALVDDLRVLGIRAEPPEAAPGDMVVLDALIADPHASRREVRVAWAICTPGEGGVGTCGDPARVTPLGTSMQATWTVAPDLLDDADDPETGRDVYVVFGVETDPLDDEVEAPHDVAFKRIRVSTSASPNANPRIERFEVEGRLAGSGAIDVVPDSSLSLDVRALPEARETYVRSDGGEQREDARYSWWMTGESVESSVTYGDDRGVSANRWRIPADAARSPHATIWVVLRDGRGGTDWASQPVRLDEAAAP